jgi:hypothetical protein
MNTNFSLKPGSTSTTKMLLSLLREKDWTLQELMDELCCARVSLYSNLTYYRKIGLVERVGVKPCYVYKLKKT